MGVAGPASPPPRRGRRGRGPPRGWAPGGSISADCWIVDPENMEHIFLTPFNPTL